MMIATLVMYVCLSVAPTGQCNSWQVTAPASWEGPEAPQECEDNRRELQAALTPANRKRVVFECESQSAEKEAPAKVSWKF